MNFLEDLDAPPIKKPSTSLISLNCATLELSTDPPYNTGGDFLLLNTLINTFLINLDVLIKSLASGIAPVPIDHIGS